MKAQSNFAWGKGSDQKNGADILGTASDDSGNVYITGLFLDTISFGPYMLVGNTYNSFYIVKRNSSGTVLWAKTAPATSDVVSYALACDGYGNVFVTGTFKASSLVFGSYTLHNSLGSSTDIFIVKYSPGGTVLWAKSYGGTLQEGTNAICCDRKGNSYITGAFQTSSMQFGSFTVTNNSSISMFVVKSDPNGNVLWAKYGVQNPSINEYTFGNDVNYGAMDHIYLLGTFGSHYMSIGNDTLFNANFPKSQFFVIKFDTLGNYVWGLTSLDNKEISADQIVTDHTENFYLSGRFNDSTCIFGSYTLLNSSFNNTTNLGGSDDVFLVKYDSSGNILWALSGGGNNALSGTGLTLDNLGNVYVSGQIEILLYNYYVAFGNDTLRPDPSSNDFSSFLVNFDPAGNELCATRIRIGGMYPTVLAADHTSNSVYMSGYSHDTQVFGPDTLRGPSIPVFIFTAKWNCDLASVNEIAASNSFFNFSIYPNPTNSNTTLSFNLTENDRVKISLIDFQGREIATFPEKEFSKGNETFDIDMHDFPAGIYLCRLQSSSGVAQQLLVKTQ